MQNNHPLLIVLTMIVGVFSAASSQAQQKVADTAYTNAKIYTVNGKQPWAEAIAVKDGRFLVVGSSADVRAVTGKDTDVVDLGGRFDMPGIHDTHIHPVFPYMDAEAGWLDINPTMSKDELEKAIRDYVKANPGDDWVRGEGWGADLFPGGKATKEWLDSLVSGRPAVLLDETGHNAVANSEALALAGITRDTPEPPLGAIDKDPETGEPTGYLGETGVGVVLELMPIPDVDVHIRALERALEEISAYGITSIVDMGVYDQVLDAFMALEKRGDLSVRLDATIMMNDYRGDLPDPDPLLATSNKYETHLIDPHNVKFWADGTPFTHTSLLLAPYTDDPTTKGMLTVTPDHLASFPDLDQKGLVIRVHAITDGTVRTALDAMERARKANPDNRTSHHISHLALVHPDDIPRFRELNINAEFSPAMWYPMSLSTIAPIFVGDERMKRWQPIAEFVKAGVNVSYGSDWPSGTPDADCWRGLEGMVTRRDPTGEYTDEGQLGEPVDLETGLRILTINGARTMHQGDVTGSIETGKYADFIVLDRNLFDIPTDQIADTKVVTTVLGGKVVYQSSEQSNARIDRQRKATLAALPFYTHRH